MSIQTKRSHKATPDSPAFLKPGTVTETIKAVAKATMGTVGSWKQRKGERWK